MAILERAYPKAVGVGSPKAKALGYLEEKQRHNAGVLRSAQNDKICGREG
jgi:hypothetical protein